MDNGRYNCEKCAKSFSQKSQFDKHANCKDSCNYQTNKTFEERIDDINRILVDTEQQYSNINKIFIDTDKKIVDVEKLLIDIDKISIYVENLLIDNDKISIDVENLLIDIDNDKKLILNSTDDIIIANIAEHMDFSKMSKLELLEKCKELGITKCSSKNKSQLMELINSKTKLQNVTVEKPKPITEQSANPTAGKLQNIIVEKPRIDTPQPQPQPDGKLKMVDLFAGTGAFSLAFQSTNAVGVVFANDMVEHSKKIYDENFNHKLTLKDLNEVNVEEIPPHDILTGGFPCFIAGTLTLTDNGYKNIEDVELTDKLLTHSGKFQKILNLQKKMYSGDVFDINLKYHPEIITATEDHPFYVREKKGDKLFGSSVWKKANELTLNDYFGMVINTNEIIPEFTFNATENQHIRLDSLDYWFVMGYLVGDGCVEETINDEVVDKINKVIPITDKKRDSGCSTIIWYNILKQFGKYAHRKLIPEWVQDAPREFIQEFINGYMKADGCINNNKILQITTVSSNLAYGLQRLYLKLGHIFSITKCIRSKTTIIEGRTVNQRDTYCIRGVLSRDRAVSSFIEDNYVWFAPFEISKREIAETAVYNFEVENDNSYIVMNAIVHNCQPFSIAGLQAGFNDERSNVFWKILAIIDRHQPKCVILENVKNLVSHDEQRTFNTIKGNLENRGYNICYKILNTADITGIPQHRERIYIVCIKSKSVFDKFTLDFPRIEKRKISEFYENDVPEKYYYTDKSSTWGIIKESVVKKDTVYQYRRVYVRENKSSECPTLTANMGSGGHNVPLVLDEKGIRKLTPRECFNLQGFPVSYKFPVLSDTNLYKLAGNAVSLPVVNLIANRLIPLLQEE